MLSADKLIIDKYDSLCDIAEKLYKRLDESDKYEDFKELHFILTLLDRADFLLDNLKQNKKGDDDAESGTT